MVAGVSYVASRIEESRLQTEHILRQRNLENRSHSLDLAAMIETAQQSSPRENLEHALEAHERFMLGRQKDEEPSKYDKKLAEQRERIRRRRERGEQVE